MRADVPGHRRPCREGGGDRDHQPAVLRMVAGHPQPAAVQGADRSADGPCAHHHHRHRLLPVPPHQRSAQGRQDMSKTAKENRRSNGGWARIRQHYWARIHGQSHADTFGVVVVNGNEDCDLPFGRPGRGHVGAPHRVDGIGDDGAVMVARSARLNRGLTVVVRRFARSPLQKAKARAVALTRSLA